MPRTLKGLLYDILTVEPDLIYKIEIYGNTDSIFKPLQATVKKCLTHYYILFFDKTSDICFTFDSMVFSICNKLRGLDSYKIHAYGPFTRRLFLWTLEIDFIYDYMSWINI